jgi:hypothetical protein
MAGVVAGKVAVVPGAGGGIGPDPGVERELRGGPWTAAELAEARERISRRAAASGQIEKAPDPAGSAPSEGVRRWRAPSPQFE